MRLKPKMPNIFTRRYSSSALIAYAFAMLLFALLAFLGDVSQLERVATAISVGGFFIVAGDLLSQPYPLSVERYNISVEFCKLSDILCKTINIDNHFIDGEKAIDWLNMKASEAVKEKANCERNLKIEKPAFYVSIIFTTIGFSSLLLVKDSDNIYALFDKPAQQVITILSFFLLTLTLILKEKGKVILEESRKDKESVVKITHKMLYPKSNSEEHNGEHCYNKEDE